MNCNDTDPLVSFYHSVLCLERKLKTDVRILDWLILNLLAANHASTDLANQLGIGDLHSEKIETNVMTKFIYRILDDETLYRKILWLILARMIGSKSSGYGKN